MSLRQPAISVCVPLYNRAHHLAALLDSVFRQDFDDFTVVLAEDQSPQRTEIRAIVESYQVRFPDRIQYFENPMNLGYDGNIRRLVELATGRYCFFMGNDDIMCAGALAEVARLTAQEDVGLVLKSYAWFDQTEDKLNQEVRFFSDYRRFDPGREAVSVCFRRSGVISGYVIHRAAAAAVATSKFDGTLFYQLYLTGSVLAKMTAVSTPKVLVLCRSSEPPDFGNSASEKGRFTPGGYTPEARLRMVHGALSIARHIEETYQLGVFEDVRKDYANYFFPYIRDQLSLPLHRYASLYRRFCLMGFAKYPLFHFYFVTCYILGEKRFDKLAAFLKSHLGRTPHFGLANTGTVNEHASN